MRGYWLWVGVLLATGCGLTTKPLTPADQELDLDRGSVHVHLGIAREVPVGTKRLDLSKLLDAEKVFEEIKKGRRSARDVTISRQVDGSVVISTLAPESTESTISSEVSGGATGSRTSASASESATSQGTSADGHTSSDTTTASSSTTNAMDTTATTNDGSSVTEKSTRMGSAGAPEGRVAAPSPSPPELSAPYHQLLYATADTILGGRALQELYNVSALPKGYHLVSLPVMASFKPGRITGLDYTAEVRIDLLAKSCGLEDATIVAVGPAGFSGFVNDASSVFEGISASFGVAIPFEAFLASAKVGTILEELRRFAEVVRSPEFHVSIESPTRLNVSYLGTKFEQGKKWHTRLVPSNFAAELLVVGKPPKNADPVSCTATATGTATALLNNYFPPTADPSMLERLGLELTSFVAAPVAVSPAKQAILSEELVSVSAVDTLGIPYLSTWSFRPTLPLNGERWAPSAYGDFSVGQAKLYLSPTVGVLVSKAARIPGDDKRVLLSLKGPTAKGKLCVVLTDQQRVYELADREMDSTLLVQFDSDIPKTDTALRIKFIESGNSCESVDAQNWRVLTLGKLEDKTEIPPSLKIQSATGILETDELVVKLELDGPLAKQPTVRINGMTATVRSYTQRPTNGDAKGATLFAAVAEKSSEEHTRFRTLEVRVEGEAQGVGTAITASTTVVAYW